MNEFNVDLSEVSSEKKVLNEVSEEELAKAREEFAKIEEKFYNGQELTIEDMIPIVRFNRLDRKYKFCLKPVKEPKVKKPKKLSRKAMVELYEKREAGEDLSEEETLNLNHSLELYGGRKLSKKDLKLLLLKKFKNESFTEIEEKDYKFNTEFLEAQ